MRQDYKPPKPALSDISVLANPTLVPYFPQTVPPTGGKCSNT